MGPNFKTPLYVKACLIPLGFIAFTLVLYITQGILVPFIYATIIAIVLSPVVNYLVRKKINRIVAIAITIVLLIVITIAIIGLLMSQASLFSEAFPQLLSKFHSLLHQSESWASEHFHISTKQIKSWIDETNAEILKGSRALIGKTLINIGSLLVIVFLIPVYIFMILYYQDHILIFIHRLFSANKMEALNEVLSTSKKIIQSYLVGLMLEALIVATLNSCSLLLLGIDYAILLGVMGALVNVIPYVGGIVAVAMPMIIALATHSPSHALMVLAAYIIIQFIDNHYIIPKVVASKVKINALVSMMVVLAGGALWGLPGMFLSIPLTAILKVIFDRVEGLKPWGYLLGNVVPSKPAALFKPSRAKRQ